MTRVTLYSRPGCHLCDEARAIILSIRESGGGFELEEIDIETDDELHARFLERIPVVEVDGQAVTELQVDPGAIHAALGGRGIGTVRHMTIHDGREA